MTAIAGPGHRTVLASAGSGKTFALTTRYLALVAGGAPVPGILATSFTRAAAGEIRDRILARAVKLVDSSEERRTFVVQAGLAPDGAPDAAIEAAFGVAGARRVLVAVARQVHRMQVRTLDSLFGAVTTAFALDLGLPADLRLADEVEGERLRVEAVRRMLDEADASESERFLAILRRLTHGLPVRSVLAQVDEVTKQLLELHRDTAGTPEAWDRIEPPRADLDAAAVERIALALQAHEAPEGARWTTAIRRAGGRLAAGDAEGFLLDTVVRAVIEARPFSGKDADPATVELLGPAIAHASREIAVSVRDRTLATRDLLERFAVVWDRVRGERGVLTFSDLVRAAGRALREQSLAHVAERLDARVEHLLLDEFQDTSLVQWQALEPIAHEIVADETTGRTLFCVGDVKQSIYGWRQAAPAVLERLPELLLGAHGRETIREETLALSRRSSAEIMEVVNRIFSCLAPGDGDDAPDGGPPTAPRGSATLSRAGVAEAGRAWGRGFRAHSTAREEPGRAAVILTPSGHDRGRTRLEVAAERARDARAARPGATIGVLCRSNANVGRVRRLLAAMDPPVPSSGPGGAALPETSGVGVLLDCLVLAEHPGDGPARLNVASSPLGARFAGRPWSPDATPASGATLARAIARDLERRGLAAAVADWALLLRPHLDAREAARTLRLVELAGEVQGRAGAAPATPGDLVRAAASARVAEPAGASVTVMTVHQSKGLEFDVVILADVDDAFDLGDREPVAIAREDEIGPVSGVCRRVRRDLRSVEANIEEIHDAARRAVVRDALSLLYVAITRAKRELVVLVSRLSERGDRQPRTGDFLCEGLGIDRTGEEGIAWAIGDPAWTLPAAATTAAVGEDARAAASGDAAPVADALRLAPARRGPWRLGSAARAASSLGHGDDGGDAGERAASAAPGGLGHGRLADHLEPGGVAARARGTVLHAFYESVAWIDEAGPPSDDALRAIAARVHPRADADWTEARIESFRRQLALPAVAAALSRAGRIAEGAALEVRAELPVASIEDGRLRRGFVDRVVLERDAGGRVIAAEVLDFKTDLVDGAEADVRAEGYAAQLAAYRTAVARRFGLDPARVVARILLVEPGRLYEVPAAAPPRAVAVGD